MIYYRIERGRLVGYMEDAIEGGKDRVDVERLG